MIKVEDINVWGFEHAVRGARNPMNSWSRSDSGWVTTTDCESPVFRVGPNDLGLLQRLYKAGTEHRTYARMVQVSMDITAPLYWWKEMDRYTIGKSQVSCSTMHKIADKEFEMDDFSHEHLIDISETVMAEICRVLNAWRNLYLDSKSKEDWWQIIQLLPSSYNQKRTVCMSYETVFKIIHEREHHKLDEWREFVGLLRSLPCVKEIMDGMETE